jgi:hypothetical protein
VAPLGVLQRCDAPLVRKATTDASRAAPPSHTDRLALPPNPLPGETFLLGKNTIAKSIEPGLIEKLREEELEEARSMQSGMLPMLPTEPLRCGTTPRIVRTASSAYMAAGKPLPDTSPRYKPRQPSVSSK